MLRMRAPCRWFPLFDVDGAIVSMLPLVMLHVPLIQFLLLLITVMLCCCRATVCSSLM